MENIHKTILFIIHNMIKQNQAITLEIINESLKFINLSEIVLKDEIQYLVQDKYVLIDDKFVVSLTDSGEELACQIAKEKTNEDFNTFMKAATSSEAYLDFCEELSGYRIYLFNMMDKVQLEELFHNIPITKEDTVLDLGCGSGSILNQLVERYGCKGIGIDGIEANIACKDNKHITYLKGDLDQYENYQVNPDIIIAIDSFYFSNDLTKLLASMKNKRLYIYYSQYIFDDMINNKDILRKDDTTVAQALKSNNIAYHTIEYSESEHNFYIDALRILPKYKKAFEKEGNMDLYNRRMLEYQFGKQLYENGQASRYLYYL